MTRRTKICLLGLGLLIGVGLLFAGARIAFAEPGAQEQQQPDPCVPAPEIIEHMQKSFGEVSIMGALDPQRRAVTIVFANPETREGSLVLISPDGKACVVAALKRLKVDPRAAGFVGDAPAPIDPES